MERLSPIGWALRPLQKYASFSGRASRAEFWWFFLFGIIFYLVVSFLFGVGMGSVMSFAPGNSAAVGGLGIGMLLLLLVWLALLIPTFAVQVRRLHDTNRSGWWIGAFYLLYFVYIFMMFRIIGSVATGAIQSGSEGSMMAMSAMGLLFFVYTIVLIVFFCLPGTRGPNRFGEDPYGANVEEVFA